ncbi:hypothetical protein [Sphingobacterium paludis]|uniref:Uncharacterized protein n=1 Tax=Sphingobacterium paludis TaxID=1476465 RepID=A0A4R7D787_9SPHI|nr:hypothetical protein [Sphingobacterium paludis]TDS16071.1 hypothetical protein B0I21_102396 [Sphingobacterium paludis]
MKNLNLEKLSLKELQKDELLEIQGGANALVTVYGAVEAAYEGVKRGIRWIKNRF